MNMKYFRPIVASLGVLGVIFAPPWFTFICMLLLALRFSAWEVMLIGILMDFLWLPAATHQFPVFTFAGLLLVWGLEPLRREFLFFR